MGELMALDSQGFDPKDLDDIRNDIAERLRIALGSDIDTSASSRIGQFIDIVSNEISDTWQALQDIYNSFSPDTASGVSLDNVVSITNTTRRLATRASGDIYFGGDESTVIPAGTLVLKSGTQERFSTVTEVTIANTHNLITVLQRPNSGSFELTWDGTETATINFNDDEATIEAAIEANAKIDDVTILGTLQTGGFQIEFTTDTLASREPQITANNLQRNAVDIPDSDLFADFSSPTATQATSVNIKAITVPEGSIQTLVTQISGLTHCNNILEGSSGTDRETDAQLRERREEELQKAGTTTNGGMAEKVGEVSTVTNVTIIENDTSVTDSDGRPPHSFEVYVSASNTQSVNDDVAQAIYDSKPIGIGITSTVAPANQRTGNYVDVNEESQTLTFSTPDDLLVEVDVQITEDDETTFPSDGEQQVTDAINAYFDSLDLGEDVYNNLISAAVSTVPGIAVLVVTSGPDGGALGNGKTSVDINEIGKLQTLTITVT